MVGLGYTLYDGINALVWSGPPKSRKRRATEQKEIVGTIVLSFLAAILIFVAVPFFTASWIYAEGIWFNVLEGLFRAVIFVGYLVRNFIPERCKGSVPVPRS